MPDGRYQHCRPLTDEEYLALKADIELNGILEYVHVDENGAILVGHHRARAAGELGIEYPRHVVAGLSELQKHEYAVRLESLGRARDAETKRYTALDLWRDPNVKVSQKHIAELVGVDPSTVSRWIREDDAQREQQPPSNCTRNFSPPEPDLAENQRGQMRPTTYQRRESAVPDTAPSEPDDEQSYPDVDLPPSAEYPGRWVDPTRPEPPTVGEVQGEHPQVFDDAGLAEAEARIRRRNVASRVLVNALELVLTCEPEDMVGGLAPEELPTLALDLDRVIGWLSRAHQLALDPRAQIRSVP